jgi:hypothetical protein
MSETKNMGPTEYAAFLESLKVNSELPREINGFNMSAPVERLKRNAYSRHYTSSHFWRDVHSGEVDYLEIDSGVIKAYEFTYNNLLNKKKFNKMFKTTYGPTDYQILDKDSFIPFISL